MTSPDPSLTVPALRARARAIFDAGVAAADPGRAVARWLARGELDPPGPGGSQIVIAFGKAALGMADAARAVLGPVETLVVTNYENAAGQTAAEGMTVMAAGHPVPDANGAAAAEAILQRLARAGAADRVLALVSGGGSALLPAPAGTISLADKAEVNRLLLASGAEIEEMNLVRQNLSRLKGGGFLRQAAPAPVTALILSDVVGDDPWSSPRVRRSRRWAARGRPDGTGRAGPLGCPCRKRSGGTRPGPRRCPGDVFAAQCVVGNVLVGSNAPSVAAMVAAGARAHHRPLVGDVGAAAEEVVAAAPVSCRPAPHWPSGETTVDAPRHGQGRAQLEPICPGSPSAAAARATGRSWRRHGRARRADGGGRRSRTPARTRCRAGWRRCWRTTIPTARWRLRAISVTGATGIFNVADLAVLVRGTA